MSYIDANLMNDEALIHKTRLHPITLVGPFFVIGVLGGIVARFYPLVANNLFLIAVISLIGIVCVIRLIARLIFWISSEFGITSKRVLGKTGLIWRHSLDIVLAKVEAIRLRQTLLGRVFDYGDLEVTGTGGTEEILSYIPHPLRFRKIIQEQVWNLHDDPPINRTSDRQNIRSYTTIVHEHR